MTRFFYYESFILLFYTMSPIGQKMSGTLYISFENVDVFNDLYKFEKEFKKKIQILISTQLNIAKKNY
jgi:hypothetical protein